jgi:hypothetical protein
MNPFGRNIKPGRKKRWYSLKAAIFRNTGRVENKNPEDRNMLG